MKRSKPRQHAHDLEGMKPCQEIGQRLGWARYLTLSIQLLREDCRWVRENGT